MQKISFLRIKEEQLDFTTVVSLEKSMLSLMKSDSKAILIDMSNVVYADSRAIGLFVGLKIQCDSKKKLLGLFNLHSDVRYIFKVTAVDTAIKIYDNELDAVRAIKKELDE